jgi:hypothetical protein
MQLWGLQMMINLNFITTVNIATYALMTSALDRARSDLAFPILPYFYTSMRITLVYLEIHIA